MFFSKKQNTKIKVLAAMTVLAGLFLIASGALPSFSSFLKTLIKTEKTKAQSFQMQTGYYIGSGASNLEISGLGFQPEVVIIKSDTAAGAGVFKTSAMPSPNTAFFSATADNTASNITFTSDGFSLGTLANVNTVNIRYVWIAFRGSDCSSDGAICAGTYTGDGVSPRTIATGFQPALAIVKRSTAVAAHFRVASHPDLRTSFFTTTADDTAGNYIRSFVSNGFTVGGTDNVSGGVYYYIAFRQVSGIMAQGTYSGDGLDDRDITGAGFRPDWVFVKNSTSGTLANRNPLMSVNESYGDSSSYLGSATANVVNGIQALLSNGFQVGSLANVNESGQTIYWAAFGGAAAPTAAGGFFVKSGSYTGNGTSQSISGLGFSPDLVIIKAETAQLAVFRTKMMRGDSTAYFSSATANFAGGITSLDSDGFSVGSSATVNSSGVIYHWQAFGNAFNPYTNSGSERFAIGAYYGNAIDNRNITRLPWQPAMVTVKRSGATAGAWRSSALSGDLSSFFAATAEAADVIQSLNSDGFQIGASAYVNTAANTYWWFAFRAGANFKVDTYTGTGSAQNIPVGFRPELVWVKRSTAIAGVHRGSSIAGNSTQYFTATANVADRITALIDTGFSVGGAQTETNTSGGTYRYAAWQFPSVMTASSTGTQTANLDFYSSDNYLGGAFTFISNSGTATITAITLTETGTVNAAQNIANVRIYYETADTCQYNGNETLFGSIASSTTEQFTISGNMPVGTSQVCAYVVLDVGKLANKDDTLDMEISNPSTDVSVSAGLVEPSTPVAIDGSTTLRAPALWQNYFRFYVDNDALNPTDPWPPGGSDLGENQPLTSADEPLETGERIRIRMSLYQNGDMALPASTWSFRLQFGQKETSCEAVTNWTNLGGPTSGEIWRGYDGTINDGALLSTNPPLPEDLKLSVSDRAGTYEEDNDTALNPYAVNVGEDVEYDWLIQNNGAAASTTYCFRMIRSDVQIFAGYNYYPEITTAPLPSEGTYWLSVGPVDGSAVSGYVFASVFNPSDSGRTAIIKRIFIQADAAAAANWADINLRKIEAVSGGTLISVADIPKKTVGSATSSLDIRYSGPTVTFSAGSSANAKLMAVVPAAAVGAAYGWKELVFGDSDEKLILQPGEGIALYQIAAGDVDHRLRLSLEWQETANPVSAQNEFLFAYPRVEVAATANYVYHSFFNPSGSGKTALIKRIWVDIDADAGAVYTNNITLRRISAASGGAAISSSDIPKKQKNSASSAMDFRYANVSVTFSGGTNSRLISLTPPGAANEPHSHYEIHFKDNDEKLILREGEGVALYSEGAGDADQIVRLSIEWQEVNSPPASQGEYLMSIGPVLGQAAANTNYLTFFNPANSGKTAVVKRMQLRVNAVAAATYIPMFVQRISAASGGTLITSSEIPKKHSSSADSAMEIRTAPGISATLQGSAGTASLLEVTAPAAASQLIGHQEIIFNDNDNEKLILQPGQGIVVQAQGTDDADHRVRLLIEWDEENSPPASQNEYLMAIGEVNGSTAAGYNYISFFNPATSTKTAVIKRAAVRVDTVAAAVYIPMTLRRISTASGGTLISANDIPKKHSSSATSSLDIRTANPTVTMVGSSDYRLTSVTTPGAVGAALAPHLTGYKELILKNEEKIILQPGEGLVLYQEAAGDADFRVRLIIEWQEIDSPPSNEDEYLFSSPTINGSANADYVYASIFNPTGSERILKIKRAGIRVSAAAAAVYIPMTLRKINSASGGSLIATSDIPKKNTGSAASGAQIRHTGATVSWPSGADSRFIGVLTPGAVGQVNGLYEAALVFEEELVLSEGEGLAVFQEAAGDANFRVMAQFDWREEGPTLTAGAAGSHIANVNFNSSNNYLGGAFTFQRNTGSTNITGITLTETGSINADQNLSNVRIYYETADTCEYNGTELLFGSSTAFSGEQITISGSMPIGTSQVCAYVVLDVGAWANKSDNIKITINNPSVDVAVSGGGVEPSTSIGPSGSTNVLAPSFAQNYFRFYVDNDALLPTDPWPPGTSDLNENEPITLLTEPLASGERVRIRTSLNQNGDLTLPDSTWSFKLQFGEKTTSCAAISSWTDLGAPASSTIWRGYDGTPVDGTALSGDPPTGGDLVLSVSDRAGTYEEDNDTALNPYAVNVGEDVEYDWLIENNGANASTTYCFRMLRSDNQVLAGYNYYPEITTAGFRPKSQNWRWYDDENNETPNSPLAAENTAPIEIQNGNILKLRLTIAETANMAGENIKFKLQFSQYSDFSQGVQDVVEISNCQSNSLWCWADGAGEDNAIITTRVLSDSTYNGTHNESGTSSSTFDPPANTATEYEFTIKHAGARANAVYFFRAYDVTNNLPVPLNSGETYPSLTTEGAKLTFTIDGVNAGVFTEGITTDATTTATSVPFGVLRPDISKKLAQRLSVNTNATEGYQIFVFQTQGLLNELNEEIPPVSGTNESPKSWDICWQSATSSGCYGYHTGDDVLYGGDIRFLLDDTYARFENEAKEVVYNSGPANESTDFIYRVEIKAAQPLGNYQTQVGFIIVTAF